METETEPNDPANEEHGGHRKLSIVLIVLAAIIGIVSVFAVWAQRQLLDQQAWSQTSEKLIENQDIQTALADYIVTEVYDNVDVEGDLAERLPPELAPLAGPLSGALRQPAQDVAVKALQQPKVQNLWVSASDAAHQRLVSLIEDKGQYVSTSGGVVTLDLQSLLEAVTAQLGIGSKAVAKLPASTASIEIMKSNELSAVQTGVNALKTAAWLLTALALLLFALAIYLGRGRRRETLRDVGIAVVGVGVIVLFARGIAGNALVGSLSGAASVDSAVSATYDIATSLLKETAQSIVIYGVLVVLAAWVSGPSARATAVRRSMTPWLRQPHFAYGGLALILVLLFWWGPLVATQRLLPSLLLIALAVAGVELLRRQVIAEFPDLLSPEPGSSPGHRIAGWFQALRGPEGGSVPSEPVPAGADHIADLERLARLREAGALSEDEFAKEKKRLEPGSD